MSDRTVHAEIEDGMQIVRYDRAGKWYAENIVKRRVLTLTEAVAAAKEIERIGGRVYLKAPGGGAFDARFRRTP